MYVCRWLEVVRQARCPRSWWALRHQVSGSSFYVFGSDSGCVQREFAGMPYPWNFRFDCVLLGEVFACLAAQCRGEGLCLQSEL